LIFINTIVALAQRSARVAGDPDPSQQSPSLKAGTIAPSTNNDDCRGTSRAGDRHAAVREEKGTRHMFEARKLIASVAAAALVACAVVSGSGPAAAGDSNGNFQAKLGVAGVWTDDETNSLLLNGATQLTPGTWATSNDTVIPVLTLTYYLNKNLAVELFCCFDKVHVDAKGANGALGEIADVWLFPPILTLQYHFDGLGPIKPFVGVGFEWIHYFNEKSKGGAVTGLGLTNVDFDDSFGFALQAGVDYDLGGGWSLGLDVKKVWEDTKITWSNAAGDTLVADHDVDPLIVTANLGYRFNLSDIFGSRTSAPLK
jgi:outer membrane protein